jgi:hypothetical protein
VKVRVEYMANFKQKGYTTFCHDKKELQEKIKRIEDLERTSIQVLSLSIDGKSYNPSHIS